MPTSGAFWELKCPLLTGFSRRLSASSFENLNRVISSLYVVLFVGFGVTACFLFVEARSEYNHLRQTEQSNRRRLAEVQRKLLEQEKILERLRTDPTYVEKVIRLRWGYVKPEQIIYDFRNEVSPSE